VPGGSVAVSKRVDPSSKIEYIIADWRTGAYSVRDLAAKHSVSKSFVGNHTKGVAQDTKNLVDSIVQSNQAIAELDGRSVDSVNAIVDERTAMLVAFSRAARQNMDESMQMACENQNDHRARADTILKSKEAALGKDATTAIQINSASDRTMTVNFVG